MSDFSRRLRNNIFVGAASVSFAVVAAAATQADIVGPEPAAPGQFYVGAEVGFDRVVLPDWGYGTIDRTVPSSTPAVGIDDPAVTSGGGQLTFGYVLPSAWLGSHTRIELSGGAAAGEDDDKTIGPGGGNVNFVSVDGTAEVFPLSAFNPIRGRLTTEYLASEIALRALTDFDLGSSATLTPSIAVFGGYDEQEYTMRRDRPPQRKVQ